MKLWTLTYRALEAQRLLGWRFSLTSLLWLARPLYVAFARDLDTPIHWPGVRQLTDWTRLSPAEIPLVAEIDPMMQVAEVERRLAEGQDCLLGWVGQDLAYYHWATAQPTYLAYLDKTLRPRENQVFGDGSYVAPRFRHRGIYQEATTRNLIYERERGRHSYLFLVAWWHRPSIRVNSRLGCVPVGSIGFWNLGLGRAYFTTGAVHPSSTGEFSISA